MNDNEIVLIAKVTSIYTVKENVIETKYLNERQKKLLNSKSKSIRKVNDVYKDYSNSYTATYLKVEVLNNPVIYLKFNIRKILKEATLRERFSKKLLNEILDFLPAKVEVILDKTDNKYYIKELDKLIKKALSNLIVYKHYEN